MDERLTWRRRPGALAARWAVLVPAAALSLLPFLWMAANALKPGAEAMTRVSANPFDAQFWPSSPRWANFADVWLGDDFGRYLINSVFLAVVTVAGMLATSLLAAYAFAKLRFRGKELLFSLLLSTLMIPEVVTVIPNFLAVSSLGWVDTWQGLTVPFMAGAFGIFLLRQFIRQIPEAMFDSARVDGASHLRILTLIVVPLTRGPLATIAFLDVMNTWNSLQWPLLVAQTPAWRPLSVGLARFFSEAGAQLELRMAASLVALLPIAVLFIVTQKHITETLVRTGIRD
jgi:ABC-type glycerol-3-phosphate transport system permease component